MVETTCLLKGGMEYVNHFITHQYPHFAIIPSTPSLGKSLISYSMAFTSLENPASSISPPSHTRRRVASIKSSVCVTWPGLQLDVWRPITVQLAWYQRAAELPIVLIFIHLIGIEAGDDKGIRHRTEEVCTVCQGSCSGYSLYTSIQKRIREKLHVLASAPLWNPRLPLGHLGPTPRSGRLRACYRTRERAADRRDEVGAPLDSAFAGIQRSE